MILSKLAYLRRFTQQERKSIRQASKSSADLEDYLYLMEMAQEIDTLDPDTIAAVQMLEGAGLIAAGRAVEILGNPPAPVANGDRKAYSIPNTFDKVSDYFAFLTGLNIAWNPGASRGLDADGTGYVELDGAIAGYDEIPLRGAE